MNISALEGQALLETVCYDCALYPHCEGSTMETCPKIKKELERIKNEAKI